MKTQFEALTLINGYVVSEIKESTDGFTKYYFEINGVKTDKYLDMEKTRQLRIDLIKQLQREEKAYDK
jgi:hypothetical protein